MQDAFGNTEVVFDVIVSDRQQASPQRIRNLT